VRENVDDDISTQQYFPRPHREDGRELETGLMTGGANSSLVVRRERGQQMSGTWKLLQRGPQN
jgi:hypothetical protein